MRRMVKEELRTFDGRPLFPERRSHTMQYDLSPEEATLYAQVTDYVREEMNHAERVLPDARRVNVGFALMTLQRRLASSPRAIYRSIQRRRERLEQRLRSERLLLRGRGETDAVLGADPTEPEDRSWDDWDDVYDEATQNEREDLETQVIDHAKAARTVAELATEIELLRDLEALAKRVASLGQDAKWKQLSEILDDPKMIDEHGNRRKLVIFTEFRDTLSYLAEQIRTRLGRPEAVVEIHGGVERQDRRQIVHDFMNNPEGLILVANDAAGEGVNLQRAHLVVNYDLPWNPNRLEQRFGRIHRIKQTEVCHLWNLLAKDTREGDVYFRLLEKLEIERDALGGDKVFDVLGRLFDQQPLRDLLWEAIRYCGTKSSSLPGVEAVLAEAGVPKAPEAKRAVLVGTDLSPGQIHTKADGTTIRTMWGELAWQLGGKKGYALVADSDQRATSPGSDVLAELFRQHAPVLVLIDEWVAYARQCVGKNDIPAGNFDTQASFAQALTEAAKRAPRTLVVASIPASRIEVGGQNGEHALEALKNVFERVGKAWRPASADEGFEIVRRRLFEPISDAELTKHRDATIREFRNLYRTNAAEFPGDVAEMAYEKKMLAAYPIHPELFARLYGDWSTLDKFQRTRGVLRLLARVINRLWEGGDKSLMIMPCSVPLDDGAVRSELTRYLPDVWEPIITTDVDGPESLPAEIERASPTMARVHAARRVARAIYLGTAPGSDAQNPGIDDRLIKLACAQPGETPATFGDALRKISDRARHIHQDQNRYWISTKPNLNRMADDRANDLKRDPESLWNEIKQRIRDAHKSKGSRGGFEGVHPCPDGAVDADDPVVRLVILGPEHTHKKGDLESAAAKSASALLQSRGAGPRLYQNCLLFLAPERRDLEALMDAVASFLAWKKIHAEQATLNLDEFHRNQAKTKKEELDDTVDQRIAATWQHALSPYQSAPGAAITWEERKVAGDGTLAERAWARLDKDVVFSSFGGANLGMELDKHLWQDKPHVTFGEIADWYARHVYLSRVLNRAVLAKAVEDGAAQTDIRETFATALAWDAAAGRYRGLRIHAAPSSLETTTVIIRPAIAQAQLDKERAEREAAVDTGPSGSTEHRSHPDSTPPPVGGRPPAPPPPRPITTYVATAKLDASRVGRDAGKITEEVIQHLSLLPGAEVDIRLEIHIRVPGGIGERVVRVVSENAHALGLAASNFERTDDGRVEAQQGRQRRASPDARQPAAHGSGTAHRDSRWVVRHEPYERLGEVVGECLLRHLVPQLAAARFESLVLVLGRDRLVDTHPGWRQHAHQYLVGDIPLAELTREEAEEYIRGRGIHDPAKIERIATDTAGYPYLLESEVEDEVHGQSSALSRELFVERTTQWMSPQQKQWAIRLAFLDEISIETIPRVLKDDPEVVLAWFKREASLRAPAADRWSMRPMIRTKLREHVRNDSPAKHAELLRAARGHASGTPTPASAEPVA